MAKGTLFGGYRVWVPDEQGNPLHVGRASFYKAGSSMPAQVYKDKFCNVSWGTSVPIDAHGFIGNSENGVWLSKEHLYKVVIERKVCDDPVTWETYLTTDNVGDVDEVQETPVSPYERYSVETIANLKTLYPGIHETVYVNGWFTEGDCGEPMQFKWRPGIYKTSDDGHWIRTTVTQVATSGCWEQIFEEGEIDVRKFGAIPDTDTPCDGYIRNALLFASEPHVYTVDDPKRKPRTVSFVKEGYYKLSSSLDFTQYVTNENNGNEEVPVVIYGGVAFTSSTFTRLKLGKATTVLSVARIAYGSVSLDMGATLFVHPEWFGSLREFGKNIVFVREGDQRSFRSDDRIVLDANEGSVSAKYIYAGNLKIADKSIIVDESKYIDLSDGKVDILFPLHARSVHANEYVSERGRATSRLNYSELELSDSETGFNTIVNSDGIVGRNGGFRDVAVTNELNAQGAVIQNGIVDLLNAKHLSVCTFYPDGSGTGGETDSVLEDPKNIAKGSIAIACNNSSRDLVITLPGKSGNYTIPSKRAVIFVSYGPKTYTKNVLVESYEDVTEGTVATYREEEVTVPDWYKVSG